MGASEGFKALARDKRGTTIMMFHDQSFLGNLYGVTGYADPFADPLYPQPAAEIMGGRVALAPEEAAIPASLADVVVGPETAAEVNWRRR